MVMKKKEELAAMSHEELVELAYMGQYDKYLKEEEKKENKRLKEILAAIGIAYETYKREQNG